MINAKRPKSKPTRKPALLKASSTSTGRRIPDLEAICSSAGRLSDPNSPAFLHGWQDTRVTGRKQPLNWELDPSSSGPTKTVLCEPACQMVRDTNGFGYPINRFFHVSPISNSNTRSRPWRKRTRGYAPGFPCTCRKSTARRKATPPPTGLSRKREGQTGRESRNESPAVPTAPVHTEQRRQRGTREPGMRPQNTTGQGHFGASGEIQARQATPTRHRNPR